MEIIGGKNRLNSSKPIINGIAVCNSSQARNRRCACIVKVEGGVRCLRQGTRSCERGSNTQGIIIGKRNPCHSNTWNGKGSCKRLCICVKCVYPCACRECAAIGFSPLKSYGRISRVV